ASFDKFDYSFESGYGLFTGWDTDEIHQRVFSELRVAAPEVRRLETSFAVRLPDQSEILLRVDTERFYADLRRTFPECAGEAEAFYRKINSVGAVLRRALQRSPDFLSASTSKRASFVLREGRIAAEILTSGKGATLDRLGGTSLRFRRFVDAQLQALAQGSCAEVPYLRAALTLSASLGGMFAVRGGANGLANCLAESITKSGGRIRLDTPVLRLAYDSSGAAVGVDLLSGETVKASKGVISNLTVWETYGKLIGLNRTPPEIRKQLNAVRGWGAYLLYLALDEEAAKRLSSDRLLALSDWQEDGAFSPEANQLVFAAAPEWDTRAPARKRAVTVHAFTDVDDWFTFHRDETELEVKDQEMLEQCWARLHGAMPELGSNIEVIDTATPRSFYDATRRKLGMVGGLIPAPDNFWLERPSYETSLPNLFVVSDTAYPDGIAGLTRSALTLADKLTGR
ncbi:MAG TPA: FAD-dependent oxidoreductase, partial [Pyrinomonadaceae bacterium]